MRTLRRILLQPTALLVFIFVGSIVTGTLAQRSTLPRASGASTVVTIADEYVREYTDAFPEAAGLAGLPGADQGRLSDRSTRARQAWAARQDVWLARLSSVDQSMLLGTPEWVIHGQLKERLESAQLLRVCQSELWGNVNQMDGWQVQLPRVAERQPLATPAEQEQALRRWRTFPGYIDVEIENLREGVRRGYLAPRKIAQLVVEQLDQILSAPAEESPFFPLAARGGALDLRTTWAALVRETVNPALKRYRDYLATDYSSKARDALARIIHDAA